MWGRIAAGWILFAGLAAAQPQGPTPRQLAEMTVSMAEVSIGADEHGRSELCDKLTAMRETGFPVTPAAKGEALAVACQGRPAKVFVLRLTDDVTDPKRAVCEYGAAPAGLAFDHIDWLKLRRGGLPITGSQLRERLEPLGVYTLAALLYAFGYESMQASEVRAPLHQIDGFCAGGQPAPRKR